MEDGPQFTGKQLRTLGTDRLFCKMSPFTKELKQLLSLVLDMKKKLKMMHYGVEFLSNLVSSDRSFCYHSNPLRFYSSKFPVALLTKAVYEDNLD